MLKRTVSEQQAWEACDRRDFMAAAAIWETLIRLSCTEVERDLFSAHYCYALVGLKRFDDARLICRRLFQKTNSHIHLHQLGMVEREAGQFNQALNLFLQESVLIEKDDILALAANLYERSYLKFLLKDHAEAHKLAGQCLDLSRQTDDPVMLGCACRLHGDLRREDDSSMAKMYYQLALDAFRQAEDETAVEEIANRLKDINKENLG